MSRIAVALAVAALLALVGVFVPFGGKTAVERWDSASSAGSLLEKGWAEASARWDALWGTKGEPRASQAGKASRASPTRPARAPQPGATGSAGTVASRGATAAPEPVENHTDEDRNALERIVAEHSKDRPPSR